MVSCVLSVPTLSFMPSVLRTAVLPPPSCPAKSKSAGSSDTTGLASSVATRTTAVMNKPSVTTGDTAAISKSSVQLDKRNKVFVAGDTATNAVEHTSWMAFPYADGPNTSVMPAPLPQRPRVVSVPILPLLVLPATTVSSSGHQYNQNQCCHLKVVDVIDISDTQLTSSALPSPVLISLNRRARIRCRRYRHHCHQLAQRLRCISTSSTRDLDSAVSVLKPCARVVGDCLLLDMLYPLSCF